MKASKRTSFRRGSSRLRLLNFVLIFGIIGMLFVYFAAAATMVDGMYGSFENDRVRLINKARTGNIRDLSHVECLNAVAESYVKSMAQNSYWDGDSWSIAHNPNLSAQVNCGPWTLLGENVGVTYASSTTNDVYTASQTLFNAFMGSPAHKTNIMHPDFKYVGIGAYRMTKVRPNGVVDHLWYEVQNYGNQGIDPTPATVPVDPTSTGIYDNASCNTSAFSVPSSLTAGQSFYATAKMINTGNVAWQLGNSPGNWMLGSSSGRDNTTWGLKRAYGTGSVSPGQTASFTINARAPSPSATTNYIFAWEMVKEGSYWLKDQPRNPANSSIVPLCTKTITVSGTTGGTTPPAPTSCTRQINFANIAPVTTYDGPFVQYTNTSTENRAYFYRYSSPVFYNHQITSATSPGGTYAHYDISGGHGVVYNYTPFFQSYPSASLTPRLTYHYIYTYSGRLYVRRTTISTGKTWFEPSNGGPGISWPLTNSVQNPTSTQSVYGPTLRAPCQ
jgi:hypothetical protein